MNNKVVVALLIAAVIGGVAGYAVSGGSQKSLNTELDTILKKIALLEKMGAEINWDEIIDDAFFKTDLLSELKKEIQKLGEDMRSGEGKEAKKSPVGGDLPRPVPTPEGWERKMLDNGMIEFTRNGEIWWWDPQKGGWRLPPGVTLPDPNPITPTGERLAGPGTM